MTSNIGARLITEKKISFGFNTGDADDNGDIKENVLSELKSAFRPEFLNRVDDIIVFSKLTKKEIGQIASKMLANLAERLENIDIKINFTDAVVDKLAEKGFDPIYGARPLRREIQSAIEDKLSESILDGSVKKGQSIVCDISEDEFVFQNA